MSSNTNVTSKKGKRTREENSAEEWRENKKQKRIAMINEPVIPGSQECAEFDNVCTLQKKFFVSNAIFFRSASTQMILSLFIPPHQSK